MSRLQSTLMLYLSLLVAAPVMPKTDASIDAGALEARWQTFSRTAAQTQPALDFPYAHCFKRAAAAQKVPETLLLAVARGESDFKPAARSDANAYGLMQILWPGTAKHLGLKRLSDLLEPCTNVEAGARYLKELLEHYQGNLHRALAAYNYGPSRIPVSGGKLPDGAVWYSSYILRHLDYVLHGSRKRPRGSAPRPYADQDRLFVIRFARPYRAAAFVESLQPRFGDIRLDWFRRPDEGFDVVMLYASEKELGRGRQLLADMGF
ncbi:MAG: lytic transglycosylase domain-containing protein [Pseudomonadota bacterium]|nr:lytic transglycosylase domain-containing protein [Pseudomonadota bacterium]